MAYHFGGHHSTHQTRVNTLHYINHLSFLEGVRLFHTRIIILLLSNFSNSLLISGLENSVCPNVINEQEVETTIFIFSMLENQIIPSLSLPSIKNNFQRRETFPIGLRIILLILIFLPVVYQKAYEGTSGNGMVTSKIISQIILGWISRRVYALFCQHLLGGVNEVMGDSMFSPIFMLLPMRTM